MINSSEIWQSESSMHDMLIRGPFYYSNLKIPPTAMSNKNKQNSSFIIDSFLFYIYTNLHVLLLAVKISENWMFDAFVLILVTQKYSQTIKRTDISWHK